MFKETTMASAPNSVNYTDQLPLGIEAKSQRRLFFPSTGDNYSGDGSSIIRISLNYDGMLDTNLSYLKFDYTNSIPLAGLAGDGSIYKDLGQPEIARLVVSSGGVVLEDIQDYNTLQGCIVAPCQYNEGNINDQLNNFNCFESSNGVAGTAAVALRNGTGTLKQYGIPLAALDRAADARNIGIATTNSTIGRGNTKTISYKLNSALLDNEKYLPLVLMNNGLDIEIHLAPARDVCIAENVADLAQYTITNVRYVAHLIDLQRDFYDMLRMTQQQSGGVIQIAGQTWRHFSNSVPGATTGSQSWNVPVRARSIKSVFFCGTRATSVPLSQQTACSNMMLSDYQIQIGATKYPPTAIQTEFHTNLSEPYSELMKSWGKLGSSIHDNLVNANNYAMFADLDAGGAAGAAVGLAGSPCAFAPYGIDLETFRAELENGVDTSSRALPMTLLTTHSANVSDVALTLHTFVLIDALFFINMDGSVSVSA